MKAYLMNVFVRFQVTNIMYPAFGR